jgi:mRNA interferase MazF
MIQTWRWRLFMANLDPAVGSEQAGTRPVVIVSDEGYNRSMNLVTVLPITSRRPGRRVYSNEVLLLPGMGGLTLESLALAHHIRTISKLRLRVRLGYLDYPGKHQEILVAISKHLGTWWANIGV